ncbi:hypothetical protein [Nocardioides nitrophenolicus]|uniref:hypothetical protein n=1 Tax=Nocardioides nitrophenolicus TaxID=60489 RepID=UPI00195D0E15|nr:hypothetical protein [Nocardioides nitrophenolicus]MBM7515258.1 hypothetical protein [Nocardioides nitrophenolicus]
MSRPAAVSEPTRRRFVLVAGSLVVAQLAFRAWVVLPAYFYGDDFRLLREAKDTGLSAGSLMTPYDAQLMPLGRLVAWLCSLPATPSWPLLASTLLVMTLAASVSCAWMLVTLFGRRGPSLVLLALYVSSAMTVPATTWWAAALNQLPLQTAFFLAIGCWVRHLRGEGNRWLAGTVAALVLGLAAYVKALLLVPVLAFLALAYFATGGPIRRLRTVVGRRWPAVLAAVVVGGGYAAYYLSHVPSLVSDGRPGQAGALAESMLGTSFATGAAGGPWHWDPVIAPAGLADPPAVLVHLSWVLAALLIGYLLLRRERTLRAWLLLGCYLGADFVLLLTTRTQQVGAINGAEYRYLTDAVCTLVLSLGLATTELRGAPESSRPRATPLLTRPLARPAVAVLVGVVVASGVWSTVRYAELWHGGYAGKRVLVTALADLDAAGPVDLLGQNLARIGILNPEENRTEELLPLLSRHARFPVATADPMLLEPDGQLVAADVTAATATTPGPVAGCGWALAPGRSVALPLGSPTIDVGWWARVDYLAGADTGLSIRAGDTERTVDLQRGLNRVFVRLDGAYDEIVVSGTDPGVSVCIDKITVGEPTAAGGDS